MKKDFQDMRKATKKHYSKCVFDFDYIRKKIFDLSLLRKWMKKDDLSGKVVFDVGCGSGAVGKFISMLHPRCRLFCGDISSDAVRIVKNRGLKVFVGDNLNLPLKDDISDLTVSEGVIHHTPDPYKALKELIRITRKGGIISLYVYNRRHFYYYIYNLSFVARFFYKKKITKKIVENFMFNLFHILYVQLGNLIFFKSPKIVPREISWNIFSDQILTPIAHFYSKEDIIEWASQNNLKVLDYQTSFNGQGLQFILLKM